MADVTNASKADNDPTDHWDRVSKIDANPTNPWTLASKLAPATVLSAIAIFFTWNTDEHQKAMRADLKSEREASRQFAKEAHDSFVEETERGREQTTRQWEEVRRMNLLIEQQQKQNTELLNEVKRLKTTPLLRGGSE